ncbi:MAG: hypothetical protein A3E78_11865 [Alphaproteobacteria bacterium RIFCSPHIGHO2_12_FULL_63_12]|nr:MAG: hypothetical protein A3E78_11865 [Alphaproteobacteria bacterium RIFCSPHIGHO2_12_FULL_63_12]
MNDDGFQTVIDNREPVPRLEETPLKLGAHSVIARHKDYVLERVPSIERSTRRHVFQDVTSFAQWLNRHGQKQRTEILVDEKEIAAALDADDPYTDVVKCALTFHPTFAAWSAIFGRRIDQRAFLQLVRGQRAALGNHGELLLGELRSFEVVRQGDFKHELDDRGFTRFHGSTAKQDAKGAFPAEIGVKTPIFDDIKWVDGSNDLDCSYSLEVLVEIVIEEKLAFFTLTCPSLPVVMRAARRDAVAYLRDMIEEEYLVGIGALKLEKAPDTRSGTLADTE